jgi:hypothetical protein
MARKKRATRKKSSETQNKTFGTTSFVLGLISLIALFIIGPFTLILAILAIIFAILQYKKKKTGLATAGLVLGVITIVIFIIVLILFIALFAAYFA